MEGYCFATVASEIIRRSVRGGVTPWELKILLTPDLSQVNRSRASPLFRVTLIVNGAPDPWKTGVDLVDARGYFLAWSFVDVGKWMVKSLSGEPIVVTVEIRPATTIPAKWTPARLAALGDKVAALSVAGVILAADTKLATVESWAASERKGLVIDAARRMKRAAELLLSAHAMQAGAAWDSTGPDNATVLIPEQWGYGTLADAQDVDYFAFDTPGPQEINVYFERAGADVNPLDLVQLTFDLDGVVFDDREWGVDYGPFALAAPGVGRIGLAIANKGDPGSYQVRLIPWVPPDGGGLS